MANEQSYNIEILKWLILYEKGFDVNLLKAKIRPLPLAFFTSEENEDFVFVNLI